jgi:hypothetical protein
MQKDNFFTRLDKFGESKVFYTICIVVVVFVLAYLDNH